MRRPILERVSSLIRRESRHQDVPVVWLGCPLFPVVFLYPVD